MTNKPHFTGERVPLTNLCSPKQWKTIPKTSLEDSGYPVYGANGIIGHYHDFNHAEETILIGCRGTCGQINVCPPQSYVTGNAMALDSLSDRVSLNYLEAFLRTYDFDKVIGGTSQPQITKQGLAKIMVPVPSLEEQVMIESKLQSVNSIKEAATHQLSLFDDLVKSRFVEMFGDPATADAKHELLAIGNFADVQTGATPLRRESKYYGGSIPWVKTGEVARNFANGVEENITETAIKETNCKVFPAGAVLVAMYGQGDTRGKAAILPFEAATNQACAAIMPSPAHNEVFLNAQLQLLYEDMRAKSLGGNQKNLSLGIIKSMKVILPPMEAQQEFATFVSQVDKSRFVAQQQIEKLQMLYDSLAQEYFGD